MDPRSHLICTPPRMDHPSWFPLVPSTGGYGPHPRRLIRTPVQGDYPRYHSITSPPGRASLLVALPLELSASLPPEVAHYLLCTFCVTSRLAPQCKSTANWKSLLIDLYVIFQAISSEGCMGVARIFQRGSSHWLIQRVLIRLSPEYCKLFAYKKAYKGGGVTGTPGPPPPWLRLWVASSIALAVAPLFGNTVTLAPLISAFLGAFFRGSHGVNRFQCACGLVAALGWGVRFSFASVC